MDDKDGQDSECRPAGRGQASLILILFILPIHVNCLLFDTKTAFIESLKRCLPSVVLSAKQRLMERIRQPVNGASPVQNRTERCTSAILGCPEHIQERPCD